jgi:hypothetical protein
MATTSTTRVHVRRLLVGALLGVLLAGGPGCEINSDTADDEDAGGTADFFITPKSVSLGFEETLATFAVTGGDTPLAWSVSDDSLGALTDTDGRIANYTRSGTSQGVNEITVVDVIGRTARALVVQDDTVDAGAPSIAPARSRISEADGSVTLTVNGGFPPYTWSVSDDALGILSNTTQPAVNYHRIGAAAGVNTIFVTDSVGKSASATVEQPEVSEPQDPALRVNPSRVEIAQPDGAVTLLASGGVPPYQWSVIDASLGILSNTDQSAVNYRRNGAAAGTNVVELRDSANNLVLVVIDQP